MSHKNYHRDDNHNHRIQQIDEINRRISEAKKRLRFLLGEKRRILMPDREPLPIVAALDPERWDGLS